MRVWGCVNIKERGLCLPYFSRRCGCGCGFVSISKEGAYVFLTLADVVGCGCGVVSISKKGAYVFLTLADVVGVGLCRYQRKGPMFSLL